MEVCGEVELNRNGFVVGIPYAADHVACIVAVMRCTKGASEQDERAREGGGFFPGNALHSEADATGEREGGVVVIHHSRLVNKNVRSKLSSVIVRSCGGMKRDAGRGGW